MTQLEKMQQRDICALCEALLPDAVDGTLSAAEQQAFDRHVAGCVECAAELAAARRGAAWLGMLKGNAPEPPAALLAKILAETSRAVEPAPLIAPAARVPHLPGGSLVAGWNWPEFAALRAKLTETFSFSAAGSFFQPRLAMTAAMAFFSIALTLNLAGVRLGDLTPSGIRRTVADAGASVERNFQNNPTVYKMESRVSELREDDAPQSGNGPNHSSR